MVKAPFHRGEPWRPDPPAARQLVLVVHRNTGTFNRTSLPVFLLASFVLTPASAQESLDPQSSSGAAKVAMRIERRHTAFGTDMMPIGDPDSLSPRAPERLAPLMASECGSELRIADPVLEIQELPDPVYVHNLSKSEISALENESSGKMREAAGLTLVRAGTVQTFTTPAQAESGTECVAVHGVRILPMKEVTVYVAREYPVGSCNFKAVKRHEDKHVAIARRLVSEYRARLQRVIAELELRSKGFPARDDQSATTGRIASEVVVAVQGVIDELQAAMTTANRVLDRSDTERTLKECPFW
jgi:hypothetical protein